MTKESKPKYKRTEMEAVVVRDFVKILGVMRQDMAVEVCREYLKGKGYSVIRIT